MSTYDIATPIDPTLKMTKYKRLFNKHKYVVIDTGYTARLTIGESLGESKRDPRDTFTLRDKFFECVYKDMAVNEKSNIELLFVYDKLHGDGLYRIGSDNTEINMLVECTKTLSIYNSGIACFKCDEIYYKYIDRAINCNLYCVINGVINNEIYISDKENEPTIKYVMYDTICG